MAAGRWVGRGDKNGADGAAVNAMRTLVPTVSMNGVVVIGEGEKDEAPMLFNGERVGDGTGPECDVAVDPIDGTTLTAKGMAQRAIACSPSPTAARCSTRPPSSTWTSWPPAPRPPTSSTSPRPSRRQHPPGRQGQESSPEDVTVVILDRPRHERIVKEIRETGARIKFISDGDVAGAIMAAREGTGVDLLLGIGGTPEGIISACAIKCLGGTIQGQLWPKDDEERQRALDAGHDLDRVLRHRRPGQRRQRVLRRHRHHRRRAAARGAVPRGDGADHRVARDALQVGHDPADRLDAPAVQAARLQRRSTSTAPTSRRAPTGRAPPPPARARPTRLVEAAAPAATAVKCHRPGRTVSPARLATRTARCSSTSRRRRRASTTRRSAAVRPPHTPYGSGCSRACSRHSTITGQRAQTRLAASSRDSRAAVGSLDGAKNSPPRPGGTPPPSARGLLIPSGDALGRHGGASRD